jgi:hypothetical protein
MRHSASLINNVKQMTQTPFQNMLTPLNPIHGGIGFSGMPENPNRMMQMVHMANHLNPRISKENSDIIHGYVFMNDDKILEATVRYKNYNGMNNITEGTKDSSSIYVSKFPMLNMMIVEEMENLKGGGYNFVGTVNCLIGKKIVPPFKENDFFCSQMVTKALKNSLERYQKTPLLPNKQDIKTISKNIEHLDPDLTMPAEIKQAFDTMPHYFKVSTPEI